MGLIVNKFGQEEEEKEDIEKCILVSGHNRNYYMSYTVSN